MKNYLSSFLLFFLIGSYVSAQEVRDTSDLWYVEMTNRKSYIGEIKEEQEKYFVFEIKKGSEITVRKRRIKQMELVNPIYYIDKKYYRAVSDTSAYFEDSNPEQVWYFRTKNGNEYHGKIVEERHKLFLVDTQVGKLAFPTSKIRYQEPFDSSRVFKGEYFPGYFYSSHLSFTPSGEIGNSYIQVNTITGIHGNIVLDKSVSISAGFVPLDIIEEVRDRQGDASGTFVWVSPKVALIRNPKGLRYSIGLMGGTSRENRFVDNGNFIVAYNTMTFGSEFFKANLGLGYGWYDGRLLRKPVVTGSVFLRAGKLRFVHFDALMMGPIGGYASASVRTISKNLAFDIGVTGRANRQLQNNNGYFVLPYIKVLVSIGKRKN